LSFSSLELPSDTIADTKKQHHRRERGERREGLILSLQIPRKARGGSLVKNTGFPMALCFPETKICPGYRDFEQKPMVVFLNSKISAPSALSAVKIQMGWVENRE
jgi:hypothetical protein